MNFFNEKQLTETNNHGGKFHWWLCTFNNPTCTFEELAKALRADYAVGQLEKGQQGTFHYQFVLWYRENIRASHFKNVPMWCKGIPATAVEDSINYCTKKETRESDMLTYGEKPTSAKIKLDYEKVLQLIKEGRLEEIPPELLIKYWGNIQKIFGSFSLPLQTSSTRGLWVYGESGAGKSHYARSTFSPLYIKAQNKWFDGYMGQKYILLDDFDKSGKCLGHHLKIWADKWACFGEVKGAQAGLLHSLFIITSQYTIDQIWPVEEDKELNVAIKRRFEVKIIESQSAYFNNLVLNGIIDIE